MATLTELQVNVFAAEKLASAAEEEALKGECVEAYKIALITQKRLNEAKDVLIKALENKSITCSLTGLINDRDVLNAELERTIATSKRHSSAYYLMYIDMDDFSNINNTLGHDAGDAAIKHAANLFRESDLAVRFGGDEFILAVECKNKNELNLVQYRIEQGLKSFQWNEQGYPLSASIGIVEIDEKKTAESLLKEADTEMYRVKKEKKGQLAS